MNKENWQTVRDICICLYAGFIIAVPQIGLYYAVFLAIVFGIFAAIVEKQSLVLNVPKLLHDYGINLFAAGVVIAVVRIITNSKNIDGAIITVFGFVIMFCSKKFFDICISIIKNVKELKDKN